MVRNLKDSFSYSTSWLIWYIIFSHSICKYPSFEEHWYSYVIRYLFIVYCIFGWTMDEKCVLCGCHNLPHYIVREPKTLPPNTTSRVLTVQAFTSILYQILKNDCTPSSWMRACTFSWTWCSRNYTLQFAPVVIKGKRETTTVWVFLGLHNTQWWYISLFFIDPFGIRIV